MSSEELSQAERNKEVVRGFYEAVGRTDEHGRLSGADLARVVDFFENEQEIELNWGDPYGGVFKGPDDIALGRHRLHELTGFGGSGRKPEPFEYVADGPTRVVVIATNSGAALDGTPWEMTVIELVDVVDGKVVKKRVFFQDPELLKRIALEREAALKDRLVAEYWATNNPLIGIRKGESTNIREEPA